MKVKVAVKFLDNQTKATQISQYELEGFLKDSNWKIVGYEKACVIHCMLCKPYSYIFYLVVIAFIRRFVPLISANTISVMR